MWQKINTYRETNFLKWDSFTIVGVFLLIICGVKVTTNLAQYMDVLFWDEALYLHRGVTMFPHIPKTWGPSYSLWYKFLSVFISDKIFLYYFNFKFTTIAIAVLLFLVLLSCGVRRIVAFVFSVFFLASYINMPLWPRVSHFCVLLLLGGVLIAKYQNTVLQKMIIISFTLLVCSYARPELFLPFLVAISSVFILFIKDIKQLKRKEYVLVSVLFVFTLFIVYFFRTPFNSGDSGRGIKVFLQHFAWNYTEWNQLKNVFWLDYPVIIRKYFSDSSSLSAIIQSNPIMFKQHIFSNIQNYCIEVSKIIISFFVPLFTKRINWIWIVFCIIIWSLIAFRVIRPKYIMQTFLQFVKPNVLTFFIFLIFAFPAFLASIYAYPRQHYLILQTPVLILLIALLFSVFIPQGKGEQKQIVGIALCAFFLLPTAKDFNYFSLFRQEKSLCNLETLQYLKKHIVTNDTVRVFDVEGYLTNLLPSNFTNYNDFYYQHKDDIVLSNYIQEKNIEIIYKTPSLLLLNSIQKDTALFNLLNNPSKYGFKEQKIGNFTPILLIKNTLEFR